MKKIAHVFCFAAAGLFMASSFAADLPSVKDQAEGVKGMKRQGKTGTSNDNAKHVVDENGKPIFTSASASGDSSKANSGDATKKKK